jgi:hypothetical protein
MTQVRDAGIQSSLEGDSSFPQTTRANYLRRRGKTTVEMSFLYRFSTELDGTRLVTDVVVGGIYNSMDVARTRMALLEAA